MSYFFFVYFTYLIIEESIEDDVLIFSIKNRFFQSNDE